MRGGGTPWLRCSLLPQTPVELWAIPVLGGWVGVESLAQPEEGSPQCVPPRAKLPTTSPGGISRVKPQSEDLNHQGGNKGPTPHLLPAPSLLPGPLRTSVTSTKTAWKHHQPVGHQGWGGGSHHIPWPKLDPQDAGSREQLKVMQPFCKAAALGAGGECGRGGVFVNWR